MTTNTLATLNGEAYAAPGQRFWGGINLRRTRRGAMARRVSLICSDARGAIELWQVPDLPDMGAVEIHDRTPHEGATGPAPRCPILDGATCYHDGEPLLYSKTFAPLIATGDSHTVLQLLAEHHQAHFGAPVRIR